MRVLRKRLVRLHTVDDGPSFQGVLIGFAAGHYRLRNASIVYSPERSEMLDDEAWIPRNRVFFAQTLRG